MAAVAAAATTYFSYARGGINEEQVEDLPSFEEAL